MKLLSIIGTRPNIIKLAPVHKAIVKNKHQHIILHTGQHYDDTMSKNLFEDLELPEPDYNLGIGPGSLSTKLSSMISTITDILCKELPDMVIVYGDVVSSLAGAIASVQNHFPVAHIEAGIRNNDMKITEHFNRVIIDRISQLNFCATVTDHNNLINENLQNTSKLVGDVMKDLFLMHSTKSKSNHVLLTLHRPENVDDRDKFESIIKAIEQIDKKVIWPIHHRARGALARYGMTVNGNIKLIEPQSYTDMCKLMFESSLVITDSGGVPKEAYWAKKPCIILFDDIAWPDIFATENQIIMRGNYGDISGLVDNFKGSMLHPNLFGEGDAADCIIKIIEDTNLNDIFKQ